MHCEPIAGALLARGSWTPRAPPQVCQEAGKTLAKLDHAATDAVVEHISGANGFAKLGWAQGRQELGPEAVTPQLIEMVQGLLADSRPYVRLRLRASGAFSAARRQHTTAPCNSGTYQKSKVSTVDSYEAERCSEIRPLFKST